MRCIFTIGLLSSFSLFIGCNGQTKSENGQAEIQTNNKLVGGGCDGCELMYVGMPAYLKPTDTSAAWREKGQKLLITGTVFQLGGKVPAPNVIIYYWQTDSEGYYSPQDGMDERAKRHGHIRGWVKTDHNGKYSIYTIRPAPYPNDNMPAHIIFLLRNPISQTSTTLTNLFLPMTSY